MGTPEQKELCMNIPTGLEGTELYYLEYGMYYVTSKSNLRPYKYYTESYDRVYDLFKELGILDQPDYVKAREIAVWMQTSITYGDSHSKDGTWLGIDKRCMHQYSPVCIRNLCGCWMFPARSFPAPN